MASVVVVVPDSWERAVAAFLAEKRRMNRSPRTIRLYRSSLSDRHVEAWREREGIHLAEDLTRARLRIFENTLLEGGMKPSTVAIYHRVMKTFAKFCIEEGYGGDARVLTMPAPFVPNEPHEILTMDLMSMILRAARSNRDQLIAMLFYHTGLRLSEVAALTTRDIVDGPDGSYLWVKGKGRKSRIVPLESEQINLPRLINRYILKERPRATDSSALFLTLRRGHLSHAYDPLQPHSIKVMLRRIWKRSGIHVHAHKFRHTWVTNSLTRSKDLAVVQLVAGHADPRTTMDYAEMNPAMVMAAWNGTGRGMLRRN